MSKTLQQPDCDLETTMLDIDDDIIDISKINFSDHDTWLHRPNRSRSEDSVDDLDAWLRDEVGKESADSQDNRRYIDTRTFTRPKKRSGRLSFESILEAPMPTSSDVWKHRISPSNATKRPTEKEEAEPPRNRRESTPPMLRPANPGVSGLCSAETSLTSGQESLEAFLNMSQSNGIDSFINLGEPEFNETLMNVSQPSILCTSFMSMTRDDLSQTITQPPPVNQTINQSSIEDSQILTESMMQTSMFGDVADVNFNDTFAKYSGNVTVLENTSFCSSNDRTFIEMPEALTKESLKESFNSASLDAMDVTYTPSKFNATLTNNHLLPNDPYASYIVHRDVAQTPDMMKHVASDASFIVQRETASDASFVVKKMETASDASFVVKKIETAIDASFVVKLTETASDASFVIRTVTPDIAEDTTSKLTIPNAGGRNDSFDATHNFDATFENSAAISPRKLSGNSTFRAAASPSVKSSSLTVVQSDDTYNVSQNLDATFENAQISPRKVSIKSTYKTAEQPASGKSPIKMEQNDTFNVQNFDATYERPASVSPRKSSINSTLIKAPAPLAVKSSSVTSDHAINSTFKAPTRMDTTYEHHNAADYKINDVPVTNRYNTYRKAPAPERTKKENYPTNNLTVKVDENVDTVNRGASLDNLDSTFCKPPQKIASKLNAPRALSRLPQTLQKSNPNLISNSLKSINTVGRSAIPSFGFSKLARPSTVRNVESSLSSKLYAMAKIKSGSEQRLEVTRNAGEFQISGTGGSTESIESTQSAHSAPDFDDRLSVCSDSSHTSYSMRTMNIEDLQKIGRLRAEDSLKSQSTPQPKRRVLENTWIEAAKDLPSPIMKHGSETYGSGGSSPRSVDSTVKTSSPLLSPAESLQNLTMNVSDSKDNNIRGNRLTVNRQDANLGVKKLPEPAGKPPTKSAAENRTGLKPPGSLSTGNRPASGIPRPASRIPAPRFVRPAAKNNQGDIKKGCL